MTENKRAVTVSTCSWSRCLQPQICAEKKRIEAPTVSKESELGVRLKCNL
jgi:hypothetical protein